MPHGRILAFVAFAFASSVPPGSPGAPAVEILDAAGSLPAHLSGGLRDPIGFAQASTGEYVVLDRREHTVYVVDAKQTALRKILEIGFEKGQVISPGVLALSTDDILAVADAPNGQERIQYFDLQGRQLGGFYLNTRLAPRVVVGSMVRNGVGSMHFTGRSFLVNRPETGALFSEIDLVGKTNRLIGTLRKTGFEADPDLHLAMNTGIPLTDSAGNMYFVFTTGVPMFRKYDPKGTLLYERHIEGPELDAQIQNLPTVWPRRQTGDGFLPVVEPIVRAAAVDPGGRLWVSLTAPFTYVYNATGDKIRAVQFKAAGILSPASLSFTRRGRLLVTPGCFEFDVQSMPKSNISLVFIHKPYSPGGRSFLGVMRHVSGPSETISTSIWFDESGAPMFLAPKIRELPILTERTAFFVSTSADTNHSRPFGLL